MIEHLLAAPYQYRFAQLMNILVRMLRQQGIPSYPPAHATDIHCHSATPETTAEFDFCFLSTSPKTC
jgi:hypothetical protein